MRTTRPGWGAYVVAGLALALSALAVAEAVRLYTAHNAARCSGGLGWIGPGLTLLATGAVAALATLAALVYALIVALARRSRARGACLVAGAALGALVAGGSASGAARALVGLALGAGCSWFYSVVAQALAVLLVAASAGGVLVLGRRPGARPA